MGEAARAGVGRAGQHALAGGIMQRVVEPRDRARRIAEGRMGGDVGDPLALNIDFAAVAQALEIFLAGERPILAGNDVLGLAVAHRLARRSWRRAAARRLLADMPKKSIGKVGTAR